MRAIALAVAAIALVTPVAQAASGADGVYNGSDALTGARNRRCPPGSQIRIKVVDNAFNWVLGPTAKEPVHIGPDGSFGAQNGRRYLRGHIANGTLTAHTTGEYCDYDWTLTR